jgi:hydroxymethylcytosylglucuronate/cytosylglucuronate synthase
MRVAVCGVDFGWGSAGTLIAIVKALKARAGDDVEVFGLGTSLGQRIFPSGLVSSWIDADTRQPGALEGTLRELEPDGGLVVLDPEAADEFEAAGCPVVYVDSLPYLWTEHDRMPTRVTRYCAQRSVPVPARARQVLDRFRPLVWVEPIVAPGITERTTTEIDRETAVVNVGGIHSPLADASGAASYLAVVLPPVAEALVGMGVRTLLLAGNVAPEDVPRVAGLAVERIAAPQSEFFAAVDRARYVLTSPGLNTLLELASRRPSAVVLPPQNLSQFYHHWHVASVLGPEFTVGWPDKVVTAHDIRTWHDAGEEFAVGQIYEVIRRAAVRPRAIHDDLRDNVVRALAACSERPSALEALASSSRGAQQVADVFVAVLAGR